MAYSQAWLDLEKSMGGRSTLSGDPESIRQQYAQLGAFLSAQGPPLSEAVTSEDKTVDGIMFRIYKPVVDDVAAADFLPVGIYAHGGGLVTGSVDAEDGLCRFLAEHTPSIIVSVEYRLAPEHPIPAQLEDMLTVYNNAAASLGADPARIYCVGCSSGGGLALGVANHVVQHENLYGKLAGIAVAGPVTAHWSNIPDAYKPHYTSYAEYASDVPVIDQQTMKTFFAAAQVDPDPDPQHDDDDARNRNSFFVLLAADNHKNYPPTYLASCGADPLRDDTVVMNLALRAAGVKTRHDHYPGLPHVFWIFPTLRESEVFRENFVRGIRWCLSA